MKFNKKYWGDFVFIFWLAVFTVPVTYFLIPRFSGREFATALFGINILYGVLVSIFLYFILPKSHKISRTKLWVIVVAGTIFGGGFTLLVWPR